ncbi:MAG: bifunctional hydroxymethylpyrimidine kinase/phosphomethylpyrimidine kinase [Alphaproteobacteria bacterium]|nr:bifunctional hydroxymethylpyrimidine kinase/phosphomethylpyrimidine kinase [Alphaproteobacteria bacterium]|tara:strand:- start:253 stop:1062 length:810 start_codon:yes stop_codon:yes gene_type:complete
MQGRVLIVAGSDSGGGAGIQADIKAVTALGGFAMTAITALTAQNTQGVHGIFGVDTEFVEQQMRVVLDDLGVDCLKTGMLHNVEMIETVAGVLTDAAADIPLVADPVMVAKGGARLLDDGAHAALVSLLVPRANLLTPNAPEAAALTGIEVADEDGQMRAGEALLELGAGAALVKGGHVAGDQVVDFLVTPSGTTRFSDPRIDSRHTHGTGCTLASATAAGVAQGLSLPDAVARARVYVRRAIEAAPGYGQGHGPLDHGVTFDPDRLDS